MQEYKIEAVAKKAVRRLYARKGKRLSSESFALLKKWYDGFLQDDNVCCDWRWSLLNDIHCEFEEALSYDVYSSDFKDGILTALSLGCAYLDRFVDSEDEYFKVFVERLVYMCGMIAGYILSLNLESKDERLKISSADFDEDFGMDVYGAFPTRFLNDGILIVGVIKTGAVRVGDYVGFPYLFDSDDYGSYTNSMINSVGKVTELAMFGRKQIEVKAGDVCVISVKNAGMFLKYADLQYPFHISRSKPILDIRLASVEEREKVYANEYMARHWWDTNSLELSVSDQRYLETVRTTLNISEKRTKEIELECVPLLLSENYLDCFEAVKECLNDIGN